MKKSKIATIVMFACVALFIALFITFFVVGDSFKATFNDLSVKIAGLGAGDAELKAQYEAQQAGTTSRPASGYQRFLHRLRRHFLRLIHFGPCFRRRWACR